jgi:signal transduction histidine kinase
MRPEYRLRRATTSAAAALLLAAPFLVLAAGPGQPPSGDEVYRCRDANGRYVYGQAIPAPCMEQDVEVLDGSGRVVRVIPGRRSMEEAAAQKSQEEATKAAAQRDRTLLATYLSVADIERLRDQRLELLEQQSRVTEQYIANLRERESRLIADVQRFRPYSDTPEAPPVPDHIAEEMVNTVNGLQVYEEQLAKNTAERDKLRAEFNADITRFKELKGVK